MPRAARFVGVVSWPSPPQGRGGPEGDAWAAFRPFGLAVSQGRVPSSARVLPFLALPAPGGAGCLRGSGRRWGGGRACRPSGSTCRVRLRVLGAAALFACPSVTLLSGRTLTPRPAPSASASVRSHPSPTGLSIYSVRRFRAVGAQGFRSAQIADPEVFRRSPTGRGGPSGVPPRFWEEVGGGLRGALVGIGAEEDPGDLASEDRFHPRRLRGHPGGAGSVLLVWENRDRIAGWGGT